MSHELGFDVDHSSVTKQQLIQAPSIYRAMLSSPAQSHVAPELAVVL